MSAYVLALDQGTTSSRAMLFDKDGSPVSQAPPVFPQIFPHPGWVEHNPEEIWSSQMAAASHAIERPESISGRSRRLRHHEPAGTTILWERSPVTRCTMQSYGSVAARPPIASASRLQDGIAKSGSAPASCSTRISPGRSCSGCWKRFRDCAPGPKRGTGIRYVDSWLAWRLSGGRLHVTDASNASRTLLFNVHTGEWDETLLEAMRIPAAVLPKVVPSSQVYGETDPAVFYGTALPIAEIAGDQQAAPFRACCFAPGNTKNTYGTGAFLLTNTGAKPIPSKAGLLTTVAWQIDEKTTYALEGSVFTAGAVIQWLRDGLGILPDAAASEALATSVDDCGESISCGFFRFGRSLLGSTCAGHDPGPDSRSTKAHLTRAALQAIAFQARDVLEAMTATQASSARAPRGRRRCAQ